jgi:pimeloyl-ACP methyl ester carboxylesterase
MRVNRLHLRPLLPSRSETFPFRERVLLQDETPIMHFDEGSGEALVFVHGLGSNMTHFEYMVGPLRAAGFRVCGLDLPGFGLSGKPHRSYDVRFLSDAVLHLMDQLGIERATLCGHSLGGLVCADVGLRAPGRVQRLVLISSAGLMRIPLAVQLVGRTIMRPELLAPALERNARRILNLVFAEKNEKAERFIEQSTERPDPSNRFVADLARVMWSLRRDLTGRHLLDEVQRLEMPTLVIWGGRDRLLPLGPVPAFVRQLPAGELEVIERCGHMPIIEDPETVVARMKRFIAQTASSQALRATQAS